MKEKIDTKTKSFDAVDLKRFSEKAEDGSEGFYLTGYANKKNHADSYGDIPVGDHVYDLSRLADPNSSARTAIIDHNNMVKSIVGRFVEVREDSEGLFFKLRLMDNPQTDEAKHAIEAFKSGFGVGLSIGGRWKYGREFDDGTRELIKAHIQHISLVAIGADDSATTTAQRPKSEEIESDQKTLANLESQHGKGYVDMIKGIIDEIRKGGN